MIKKLNFSFSQKHFDGISYHQKIENLANFPISNPESFYVSHFSKDFG